MPAKEDSYGTYGSVPTVQSQGVSNAGINVHANSDTFGGNVAQAVSGAGKEVEDISNHFAQVVSEAKVNDDYANKYVPAAANLRAQYDSLRGQDKIGGYDNYINGLQDLNKQFTASQPGIYGEKLMSSTIDRHITSEIFGAKRELVESQKQFADQSTYDMINANIKQASQNYSNPALVQSYEEQNNNHITKQFIDSGVDPNDAAGKSFISDAQRSAKGELGAGIINTAVNSGDAQGANEFRSRYASLLPGYQKVALDNAIHTINTKQNSSNAITALTSGRPIPEFIGSPPSKVQAIVADTAHSNEIDPNHALAVLRIESADGQNLGSRGTIGQDKGSAGKSLEDQAKALCDNLKVAGDTATASLGRQAEPWEAYMVYQQGAGGGPALLKASQDNPNMKAIDALKPLYKNPQDALDAIKNNGGNATMSASDFADHIKQVYDDNAKRANCDFGNASSPGTSLQAPHATEGVTVQPAASPIQAQLNFEKKVPAIMSQIEGLPNYDQRAGVMRAFTQERQRYNDAAVAYKNVLVNKAGQLAADPNFISMDQIPPDMQSSLATDHPQTLDYMQKKADDNLAKHSGSTTKEMKEYGNDIKETLGGIWNGDITNAAQLHDKVSNGDITIAGYDRAVKELQGKNTPEGASEGAMKKQFYENAKSQISGQDELLKIKDPKGEENYLRFLAHTLPAYDQGRSEGKTPGQLLDPDSKDYIGKSIPSFKRSLSDMMADMEKASQGLLDDKKEISKDPSAFVSGVNSVEKYLNLPITDRNLEAQASTPEGLRQAILTGKISREQGQALAIKHGYINKQQQSTASAVPLAE